MSSKNQWFITGTSTEVGKTIAAAIVTEALEADYWKPIQAGELDYSDSHKVKELLTNTITVIHPNAYALKTPMSPHAAAEIEGIQIQLDQIIAPKTVNNLVIEGAGGLLVPLNNENTIEDLIKEDYKVIVVSRHYLGSINHSLLTIERLQQKGISTIGVIFSGNKNDTTESIILKKTGAKFIGRINEETSFNPMNIKLYANKFKEALVDL